MNTAYDIGYAAGLKKAARAMEKTAQLASKEDVNYRKGTKARNCGNCRFWQGEGNDCAKVRGPISASKDCDLWAS